MHNLMIIMKSDLKLSVPGPIQNQFPTRDQRMDLARICNEAEVAMNNGAEVRGPEGDTEGITEQRVNTWFTNRRKGLGTPITPPPNKSRQYTDGSFERTPARTHTHTQARTHTHTHTQSLLQAHPSTLPCSTPPSSELVQPPHQCWLVPHHTRPSPLREWGCWGDPPPLTRPRLPLYNH